MNRLIPTIARIRLHQRQKFGSKYEYIPLLYIEDALNAIMLAIETQQQNAAATPFWNERLIVLLEDIVGKNAIDKFAYFDESRLPIFENPIEFPPPLTDFTPQFQMKELKEYIEMRTK